MKIVLLMALAMVILGDLALAAPSSVEWTPLSGAEKYEIQFKSLTETKPQTRLIPSGTTIWEENLPDGVYVYRLRGIDTFSRPGKWTEASVIVVLPSPMVKEPLSGSEFEPGTLRFVWSESGTAKKFLFVLKKDGKNFSTLRPEATEQLIEKLEPGEYSWSVRPLVDKAPAFAGGEISGEWEGPESELSTFVIAEKKVATPAAAEPPKSELSEAPKIQAKRATIYRRNGMFLRVGPGFYFQQYVVRVGAASVAGTSSMMGPGFLLHAGYSISPQATVQIQWDQLHYRIATTNVSRQSIQLLGTYAFKLSPTMSLTPHAGLETRRFFTFTPSASGMRESVLGAIAFAAGATLEKFISDRMTVALRIECHPPLSLLASEGAGALTGISVGDNLSADLSLQFRLSQMSVAAVGIVSSDRSQEFSRDSTVTSYVRDSHRGAYASLRLNW